MPFFYHIIICRLRAKITLRLIFLLSYFFICIYSKGQSSIIINGTKQEVLLSGNYSFYFDIDNKDLNGKHILQQKFVLAYNKIPSYRVGINNVWIKFNVLNKSDDSKIYLDIRYSNLSNIALYKIENNNLRLIDIQGNTVNKSYNLLLGPNYIFPIDQYLYTKQDYLLHVTSNHPIVIPAYITTEFPLQKSNLVQFTIAALFTGVLMVMIIYNLFLFFAVQDKSYLIYVLYTASLLLAQLTTDGYMSRYLWSNWIQINSYAVVLTTNLTIITGMIFAINFLQIKHFAPSVRWICLLVVFVSMIDILLCLFGTFNFSYSILNYNSLVSVLLIFFTSIYIGIKGYRPAYLYFIAWISIFISLALLVLRNINVIPYNNFTSHIVYIGAALETTLLSFALADKINLYKKEKESSQAEALRISQEKEKLIKDQNLTLEIQVKQRTAELEKTLRNLKDTQVQLVESEKMSSLGQLTAGIAHEINNPINFVKSNVSPLHMDVKDLFELITEYQQLHGANNDELPLKLNEIKTLESKLDPDFLKEEIESLIGGIEEGAERTAEIVRGLRIFSRLDESEMKEVNIYDNLNSTLILLRNATPQYIKIRKHFEATGEIECYPGKLNQVFMNILTNGIQAIKSKPVKNEEEYIDIWVTEEGECMRIAISDTGIGMTEEVKHKVFDPFFTTKDVGEGTGLGMSIVFKIIEKHHGKISVVSSPGNGAAFSIEIPYKLKAVAAMAEEQAQLFEE